MTPLDTLLNQLRALAMAQSVIDARTDLTEAFTWRCVSDAIHDRRQKLLEHAEAILRFEKTEDVTPAANEELPLTAAIPPGRVH